MQMGVIDMIWRMCVCERGNPHYIVAWVVCMPCKLMYVTLNMSTRVQKANLLMPACAVCRGKPQERQRERERIGITLHDCAASFHDFQVLHSEV